jgi:hypothetical protein
MPSDAVETLQRYLDREDDDVRAPDWAVREVLAENERLRSEVQHHIDRRREVEEWYHKAEAKIEAALAKSAAYPVTCPSCGYGWRAGLTSMARTLRGGDDGK